MGRQYFIITALLLMLGYQGIAQRNYDGYNFLGITGGITWYDIQTSDFITKPGSGFTGGFTTRGAFRNNFDLIYGINFQMSKLTIEGNSPSSSEIHEMGYTTQGVQITFLGSYNLLPKHISLEFGPILHINGKMKLDTSQYEDYIIFGYDSIYAKDIQEISLLDFRVLGGITLGLEHFRLSAHYQYGLTNTLSGLNKKELEKDDFKGNSSTIILAAVIYF